MGAVLLDEAFGVSGHGEFQTIHRGNNIMYKLVILACVLAAATGAVIPAGVVGYAAAPVGVAPVAYANAGLGLPEAATYALPPVRQVAEAPIVEQVVEPVEQWGYKVAY